MARVLLRKLVIVVGCIKSFLNRAPGFKFTLIRWGYPTTALGVIAVVATTALGPRDGLCRGRDQNRLPYYVHTTHALSPKG
jgi:hypothetical protein